MKGLKNMRAIKLLKRFAAVILAVAGLMMFSGCGADGANGGNIVEAQIDGQRRPYCDKPREQADTEARRREIHSCLCGYRPV